eukprot:scaffold236064_cov51-Attheya_sp.AAC.2
MNDGSGSADYDAMRHATCDPFRWVFSSAFVFNFACRTYSTPLYLMVDRSSKVNGRDNSDLSSTLRRESAADLRTQELEKKKKYLQPCLDSHRDFTHYVLLVDGMLATEAKELNK